MQGGDRVHCLTRRRLAAASGTAAAQSLDGGRWSRRFKLSSADLHGLHFDSTRRSDSTRTQSTGGSGLLEGSHLFSHRKAKIGGERNAKKQCNEEPCSGGR